MASNRSDSDSDLDDIPDMRERERRKKEKDDKVRYLRLRCAALSYLARDKNKHFSEGAEGLDDADPAALDVDPKDWEDCKQIIMDISQYDFRETAAPTRNENYRDDSYAAERRRSPREGSRPNMDEVDNLDLFVARRLQYKKVESRESSPSEDEQSSEVVNQESPSRLTGRARIKEEANRALESMRRRDLLKDQEQRFAAAQARERMARRLMPDANLQRVGTPMLSRNYGTTDLDITARLEAADLPGQQFSRPGVPLPRYRLPLPTRQTERSPGPLPAWGQDGAQSREAAPLGLPPELSELPGQHNRELRATGSSTLPAPSIERDAERRASGEGLQTTHPVPSTSGYTPSFPRETGEGPRQIEHPVDPSIPGFRPLPTQHAMEGTIRPQQARGLRATGEGAGQNQLNQTRQSEATREGQTHRAQPNTSGYVPSCRDQQSRAPREGLQQNQLEPQPSTSGYRPPLPTQNPRESGPTGEGQTPTQQADVPSTSGFRPPPQPPTQYNVGPNSFEYRPYTAQPTRAPSACGLRPHPSQLPPPRRVAACRPVPTNHPRGSRKRNKVHPFIEKPPLPKSSSEPKNEAPLPEQRRPSGSADDVKLRKKNMGKQPKQKQDDSTEAPKEKSSTKEETKGKGKHPEKKGKDDRPTYPKRQKNGHRLIVVKSISESNEVTPNVLPDPDEEYIQARSDRNLQSRAELIFRNSSPVCDGFLTPVGHVPRPVSRASIDAPVEVIGPNIYTGCRTPSKAGILRRLQEHERAADETADPCSPPVTPEEPAPVTPEPPPARPGFKTRLAQSIRRRMASLRQKLTALSCCKH